VVNGSRAASRRRDDSTSVGLEYSVTGGKCDIDGLILESVEVGCGAFDLSVALNSGYAIVCIVSASLLHGTVAVASLTHGVVTLEPVVGPEVPATRTAQVTSTASAVNKLLL